MTWAPFSTCWRATARAFSNSPARIMRANAFDPVTLVRSADVDEQVSGAERHGLQPGQLHRWGFLMAASAAAFSGEGMCQIVGACTQAGPSHGRYSRFRHSPWYPSVPMKVVPLSSEGLRVGRPLPFSVRDGSGAVLLARGSAIQSAKQLEVLQSREIFIDMHEMESVQRAYNGQLDQLLRNDVALGRIADARPAYNALAQPVPRPAERAFDWPQPADAPAPAAGRPPRRRTGSPACARCATTCSRWWSATRIAR